MTTPQGYEWFLSIIDYNFPQYHFKTAKQPKKEPYLLSPVSTQLKLPNKPGSELPVGGQHELQQACSPSLHHRTWTSWDFLHFPTFHLNHCFPSQYLLSSLLICVFHSSYQLPIQWGIWLIKRLASRGITALCSGTEHVSLIHASFFSLKN